MSRQKSDTTAQAETIFERRFREDDGSRVHLRVWRDRGGSPEIYYCFEHIGPDGTALDVQENIETGESIPDDLEVWDLLDRFLDEVKERREE